MFMWKAVRENYSHGKWREEERGLYEREKKEPNKRDREKN